MGWRVVRPKVPVEKVGGVVEVQHQKFHTEKPMSYVTTLKQKPNEVKRIALFPGQGVQKVGMAEPYLQNDIFMKKVDECADSFNRMGGSFHLANAMTTCQNVDDTRRAQPLLFALQCGLMEMKLASGTQFDYTVGHSLGDITAAYYGGRLTLDEAMLVIVHRANVLENAKGSMAVAMKDPVSVFSVLKKYNFGIGAENYKSHISIAGCNTPTMTTIAGGDVTDVTAALKAERISAKKVPVKYAFHSPVVTRELTSSLYEALLDELPKDAPLRPPGTPFHIPTGLLRDTDLVGRNPIALLENMIHKPSLSLSRSLYWSDQIRRPVSFSHSSELAIKLCGGPQYAAYEEVSHEPLLSRFMEKMGYSSEPNPSINTRTPCNVSRPGIAAALEEAAAKGNTNRPLRMQPPEDHPLVNRGAFDPEKEGVPPNMYDGAS
eukprot:TRINITY_DN24838_c0_g1_i1.p1 TRINITY_DN24838_c0_g1~~TRINITY_DN24838_c0_g1_i1.p1  ORF type:complete len:447 (+),score=64.47 TRINITY_DN24838_c0_g1_i1:43-1341(+)